MGKEGFGASSNNMGKLSLIINSGEFIMLL